MAVYVNTKNMSKKTQAWICIIFGLIVGTVFTFGMQYWNSPITKDEARYSEAIFSFYKEIRKDGNVNEMILYFENHDELTIDNTCCSQEVVDKIRSLKEGAIVKIYYHPNSNKIMEMTCNSNIILQFDDSASKLSRDRQGFTVLGIFMYFVTAYGITMLIRERKHSSEKYHGG